MRPVSFPGPRGVLPLLAALLTACDLGTLPPGVSSEAALTLTHVCADSFRIVNRYTPNSSHPLQVRLTATWSVTGSRFPQTALAMIQVPWAPSLSDSGVAAFRLPIPVDRPVQILATASGAPFSGRSRSLTIPGASACSDTPMIRLRTAVGFGVLGTITPEGDSVPVGAELRWQVAPAAGFDAVDVRINGQPVPPTGQMILTAPTTITAVGTAEPEIPVGLRSVLADAHALLNDPSPGPAAERLMNQLLALMAGASPAESEALLENFARHALPVDADPEAVARLDDALADVMLRIDRPTEAMLQESPPPFPAERATHFVAAGILTPQEKLVATTRVVHSLMQDRTLLGPQDLVRGFVSPTMTGLKEDARRCLVRTLSPRSIQERANAFLTHCLLLYGGLLDGIDVTEATSQILRQWIGGIPPRRTSMLFKDSLLTYRGRGDHLLITAHSQGTLIAREAIEELLRLGFYKGNSDSTCVATVAMAGPVSGNWAIPPDQVEEFATDGDLVAAFGGSTARRIPTALTRERDSVIAALPPSAKGLRLGVALAYAIRLHDLQEVYLGEAPPRNHLFASLTKLRRECEVGTLVTSVGGGHPSLIRGEELALALYLIPWNHNGRRLYGRPVQLLEASSPTLTLLNPYTIRASATGEGQVMAQVRNVRSTIGVTVTPPPVLGLTGGWGGYWRLQAPNIGGTFSVALQEAGEVNRNGQALVGGSVSYTHPHGSYTVPVVDGLVRNGVNGPQLVFRMATPEFGDIYSYAVVTLDLIGTTLNGGMMLHFGGGGFRESRILTLDRSP